MLAEHGNGDRGPGVALVGIEETAEEWPVDSKDMKVVAGDEGRVAGFVDVIERR
jgi:hypothetical protein